MIPSLNQNVSHNGRVFHIQTEDSGLPSARISTHLFLDGNVIASARSSYADLAPAIKKREELEKIVKRTMAEQHRQMARDLKTNRYEETIAELTRHVRRPARGTAALNRPAEPAPPSAGPRASSRRMDPVDEPTVSLKSTDIEQADSSVAMESGRKKAAMLASAAARSGRPAELNAVCQQVVQGAPDVLACAVIDVQTAAILGLHRVPSSLSEKFFEAVAASITQLFSGGTFWQTEEFLRQAFGETVSGVEEIFIASPPVFQFLRYIRPKQIAIVLVTTHTIDTGVGWLRLHNSTGRFLETLV